ncbi:glycosyltransferase [Seminavis robusta]|uniref:Glycosyltransferase n=1 Tax=Seminavis robusta TaxID=568900 RepID=A0A9N8EAU4_9STRA|nr:glycosyltransferase [Seminavis robusta]|eukprot:Sro875_g214360.1 glycosyltransferase (399) ;mRNA; f:16266-17462
MSTTTSRDGASVSGKYIQLFAIVFIVLSSAVGSWHKELVLLSAIVAGVNDLQGQQQRKLTSSDTETREEPKEPWEPMPISELTRGNQPLPNCTYPYVAVADIIAETDPYLEADGVTRRKIPRSIHLAWVSANDAAPRQGRCLHYLQAETFQKWNTAFPNYSVYFHDDDAVDALLDPKNWPEFPQLGQAMKCAKMRGAMLVDIWRLLVLYKYGGFYADLDLLPKPDFTEDIISPDVDFFAFSDAWSRPTQGSFAMAPGHPIGYYNIHEVMSRILNLDDIAHLKLVFVTGPEAFKFGYGLALGWKKDLIFGKGTFKGDYNATAKKVGHFEKDKVGMQTNVDYIVQLPGGGNMTYKEKIKEDTGVRHWQKEMREISKRVPQMSCREYLYKLERETARFPHQ